MPVDITGLNQTVFLSNLYTSLYLHTCIEHVKLTGQSRSVYKHFGNQPELEFVCYWPCM